jgi:hypothetical protein
LADITKILFPIRFQSQRKSFFSYLKNEVFDRCNEEAYSTEEKLISLGKGFEANKSVQAQLEMALGQNKAIAIGYCSKKVLKADPQSTKDTESYPRITRAFAKDCSAHYSLLVGSRKVGKRCDLLLRNSYGEGFWGEKGLKYWCLDESAGIQRNCSDSEKNPHLRVLGAWIDAEKITANTYEFTYFD